MAWKLVVPGILGAAAVALLIIGLMWGQGAPGSPGAQISGTLNPAVAQTLQITLTSNIFSTAPPNSIWGLGQAVVVTVSQNNANGGTTVLLQNQRYALAVLGQAGNQYVIGTTISVTTLALCPGSASCSGTPMNLTVTARAQASELGATLFSAPVTFVFSNIPAYQSVPAAGPAPTASYYLFAFVPLILALALGLWAVTIVKPEPVLTVFAVVASAGAVIGFLLW